MSDHDFNYPDVFHFDEDKDNFETHGEANGMTYWYARKFMEFLGYESFETFHKAINRAIVACSALNIPIMDNFIQIRRTEKGKEVQDYKLSRFACYLTAMNGDVRKPQVAAAQAYFATLAESFRKYFQEAENVERVTIREDVSEREKSLIGVVHKADVVNYAFFQNAGYRGMYNMNLYRLRELKGIPGRRSPLDFMGKEELAANLFRITQTEMKIEKDRIRGQADLEVTAETVGQKVRDTMIEISGTPPECLPPAEDIKKVRTKLKKTHNGFNKLDASPKPIKR